ncbi:hypothetical protein DFQ27_002898 [Actinomortierella ambigua]|uniref:non-specific serine/threonine protein kinase n=1 Tax=Actinomortierella ambigua TaxID=1343610 RepID=A0A9P6U5M5_9FUNG|nr:hypothetical protein DFQ27_002898 [Actinomortierella ambigua]
MVEAIRNEIEALRGLTDRHIIQLYGTTYHEDMLVLVMDYAEGGSLQQAIVNGLLVDDWPARIRIAREIAQGLAYLHLKKVIHRDLKSMNVLLTRHMDVKLCDFGLPTIKSKAFSLSINPRAFHGALRWMAPELLSARPQYSTKSDIYAFGMVMWEMASNCTMPFRDQLNNEAVRDNVKNGIRETMPSDTPADYRLLTERCWTPIPARRPEASELILKDSGSELAEKTTGGAHSNITGSTWPLLGMPSTSSTDIIAEPSDELSALLSRANGGDVQALLTLAATYENGVGATQSYSEAFKWFLRAAQLGSTEAEYRTGTLLKCGRGTSTDLSSAVRWIKRAAQKGHSQAQTDLGGMYMNGIGVEQDHHQASVWYQLAADQGNMLAQVNLGWLYQNGLGVSMNYEHAVSLYRKPANLGCALAQNNLGYMYLNGLGVIRDYKEAMSWYHKSVEQGLPQAQRTLGQILVFRGAAKAPMRSLLVVGSSIGPGGYGNAFHANWERRRVAIKKFPITRMHVSQDEAIQNEIETLRGLTDRHIIQLYGTTYHEDMLVLVMDYAEGGSLKQAIEDELLVNEWPARICIAREIAQGLAYLHFKKVIHRDLKSTNVLLTRHMEVKLCDHGLPTVKADSMLRLVSHPVHNGTWRWMAPELFTDQPQYSTKSDIYAFGMVMWEMAANCTLPFRDQPDNSVIMAVVKEGERELLPNDTPQSYRSWVERCWKKDPTRRPEADQMELNGIELALGCGAAIQASIQLSGLLFKAERGDVQAMLALASAYENGVGVTQSDSEAFKWLFRAAQLGSTEAEHRVGSMLKCGGGTSTDQQDLPRTQGTLSQMYSLLTLHHVVGSSIGPGYGNAFHANWERRRVAIKRFPITQKLVSQEEAIQNEIEALRGLTDRHIIQLYGTTYHEDMLVLVMDYAEGGSLKQAIENGLLVDDWPARVRIAREIAQGLAYLHFKKVIHRDLKSTNVLLTRHMDVKLCDFGLPTIKSKAFFLSNNPPAFRDTMRWMAPELLSARPQYSTKSDIYAFGMVMWEMASNCTMPFRDQLDNMAVVTSVKNGRRETLPSDTPAGYRLLTELCWDPLPARRPEASELIFKDSGSELAEKTVISAYPNITGSTWPLLGMPSTSSTDVIAEPSDELSALLSRANGGDVQALLTLAAAYESGVGIAQSDSETFKWLLRAAQLGSTEAEYRTGYMLKCGCGTSTDLSSAVRWIKRAAQKGHSQAQTDLGGMYMNGIGVEQDHHQASVWYQLAADQGNMLAQVNLGWLYQNGLGVSMNYEHALSLYRKPANRGSALAQNNLGGMYLNGLGVICDCKEAMSWYQKSAEQGLPNAQRNLGQMYEKGQGVSKDKQMASRWCKKALDQGHIIPDVRRSWWREFLEFFEFFRFYLATIRVFETMSSLIIGPSIGPGGSESTFQANWEGRRVAIKRFPITQKDVSLVEAIQNEIETLRGLTDRHIIQLYGTTYHEDMLVLVMDYAEGGSLKQAIEDELLVDDWPARIRIAREIAQGLAYLHFKKVIHRDLKSTNVLLTRHMEVKLCDHGLPTVKADSMLRLVSHPVHNGTWRWMAPELFTDQPQYSTKSDIYAFGMVMWEMAANCTLPFRDQLDKSVIMAVVKEGERELLPNDTPQSYRSWVERCWREDPTRRPEANQIGAGSIELALGYGAASQVSVQLSGLLFRAKRGDVQAMLALASAYENGVGVTQSDSEAFKWFLEAAQLGSMEAEYRTGSMLKCGCGTSIDLSSAVRWIQSAAEKGHSQAQTDLGWMLTNGFGVEKNHVKAVEWYQQAVDLGNKLALAHLGRMYLKGLGVSADLKKAAALTLRSATRGCALAQSELGELYLYGLGVVRDPKEAMSWYQKSAEQGHLQALRSHRAMLLRDIQGASQNADDQGTTKPRYTMTFCLRLLWNLA